MAEEVIASTFVVPFYSYELGRLDIYSDVFINLSFEQIKDDAKNQSTIRWKMERPIRWVGQHWNEPCGPTTLTIDGIEVFYKEYVRADVFPAMDGTSVSGSIVVPHNKDGKKTVRISLKTTIRGNENEGVTRDWVLEPVPILGTVTQAPVTVGDTAVLVIKSTYDKSFTHNIRYEFGSLSATLFTGVSAGTYSWQVPETFYEVFGPKQTKLYATLICDTYKDGTLLGSESTSFAVSIGTAVAPIINVELKDTDETTVALTGNSSIIIRGFSDVAYTLNAVGQYGATIDSVVASDGNNSYTTDTGTFVDSPSFKYEFFATDSRGLTTQKSVTNANLIDYVKPTISIEDATLEATNVLTFTLSGKCFTDTFGAVQNVVTAYYRYKLKGGSYSNWISASVTSSNFSLDISVSGLDYTKQYSLQAKIVDKLCEAVTGEVLLNAVPIFDWGENDFNFNVPVNFSARTTGLNAEDIEGSGVRYGYCETSFAIAAKTVTYPDFPKPKAGKSIRVKFKYSNTASPITLNVNGTGAYTVKVADNFDVPANIWMAGEVKDFVFDGTYWLMLDGKTASTTNYGPVMLTNTVDTSDKVPTAAAVKAAIAAGGGGGSPDIKVGTWTPKFYSGPGSGSGWYIKCGKYVVIGFNIETTGSSSYSSNEVKVSGLPFTPTVSAGGGGYLTGYTGGNSTAVFSGWRLDGSYLVAQGIQNGLYGAVTMTTVPLYYASSGAIKAGGTLLYQTFS